MLLVARTSHQIYALQRMHVTIVCAARMDRLPLLQSPSTSGYSWFVLLTLFLVYVSNQWDRSVLNSLYNVSTKNLTQSQAEFESLKVSSCAPCLCPRSLRRLASGSMTLSTASSPARALWRSTCSSGSSRCVVA